MYSTKIYISDVITARKFVAVMERYPEVNLRIKIDNLEIDPHSVMGVLTLGLNRKMTLETQDQVTNQFQRDIFPSTSDVK